MLSTRTVDISFAHPAGSRSYPVIIGTDILSHICQLVSLDRYTRVFIVCDENVSETWLPQVIEALYGARPAKAIGTVNVPAGERRKDIAEVSRVWEAMRLSGLDRRSVVLNLGGGMVGDLGGFAASCYMRGVDFVQLPTSLLAQVDASVGGKVGVNFGGIKNLVGSFQQPRAVVIDTATLGTLPEREFRSGFAEVVKHGLIRDRNYFDLCRKWQGDLSALPVLIEGSCRIKAAVVESDEREAGARKLLNFGHTIGHAIESLFLERAAAYPDAAVQPDGALLHGEAVSIGIVGEAFISQKLDLLSLEDLAAIELALEHFELPTRVAQPLSIEETLSKISFDKKNEGGKVKWTLLQGIGNAVYDHEVDETTLCAALSYLGATD